MLAKTSTRSGVEVRLSTASRTWPTSERGSRGRSTSSYADRPAIEAVPSTVTWVVGSIAASACSAAWPGVNEEATGLASSWAGSVRCLAVLSALLQVQASRPERITSVWAKSPIRAIRVRSGAAYQIWAVCEPVISEVSESDVDRPWPPRGRSGRPRRAVWTTVPENGWSTAARVEASSSAAVRGGRAGAAPATNGVTTRAAATMAAPMPGRAQRARDERRDNTGSPRGLVGFVVLSCAMPPVTTL